VKALKKTQSLMAAFGIGMVAGYFMKKRFSSRPLSPERVLSEVKSTLKKSLDVDGAWIYLQPEEWQNGKMTQSVYQGGITENQDGEAIHYDFVADASTGTIIKLEEQS
jgi:predicted small secreted protein